MGSEITLKDVYDVQMDAQRDLSGMRAQLAALTSRVDVQLAHGQRKMDDLQAANAALSARIGRLEQARWKAAGAAGALGMVTGGATGTLLSYLLSRHP